MESSVVGKKRNCDTAKISSDKRSKHEDTSDRDIFKIMNLPDDELKIVLGFLDPRDKKSLRLVCKAWINRSVNGLYKTKYYCWERGYNPFIKVEGCLFVCSKEARSNSRLKLFCQHSHHERAYLIN